MSINYFSKINFKSPFRIARRGDLKKKMLKPHERYERMWTPKNNWILSETAENQKETFTGKGTWSAVWPILATTLAMGTLYCMSEWGISPRERLFAPDAEGSQQLEPTKDKAIESWRTLVMGGEWSESQKVTGTWR